MNRSLAALLTAGALMVPSKAEAQEWCFTLTSPCLTVLSFDFVGSVGVSNPVTATLEGVWSGAFAANTRFGWSLANAGTAFLSVTSGVTFLSTISFDGAGITSAPTLDDVKTIQLGSQVCSPNTEFNTGFDPCVAGTVTPEPSTWLLMVTGLLGIGFAARARRRASSPGPDSRSAGRRLSSCPG